MNTFKPPHVSKRELIGQLKESSVLTSRVQMALEYAERAHGDQKRDQGNPYLEEHIYPIASGIVKRHKNNSKLEDILILGILHDVLEDDPRVSLSDIKKHFGNNIAINLALVTKNPRENADHLSEEEKKVINTKMLKNLESASFMAQIIKLEDRLNNISSIEKVDVPKYQRNAEETKSIFIPFAKRVAPIYVKLLEEQLDRLAA